MRTDCRIDVTSSSSSFTWCSLYFELVIFMKNRHSSVRVLNSGSQNARSIRKTNCVNISDRDGRVADDSILKCKDQVINKTNKTFIIKIRYREARNCYSTFLPTNQILN